MKLSDGEKLILIMLSELYTALDLKGGEVDPEFVKSAIFGDHLWGLRWKYSGIPFEAEDNPPILQETIEILDMWRFIERGYQALSDADKEKLKEEANTFGDEPRFDGFDGNNEYEHLGVANFLINELGRWQEFKDRDLNSHSLSLDGYQHMLEVFQPIKEAAGFRRLWLQQLIDVLNARMFSE